MSIFPDDLDPTYQDYVTKFLEYEEETEDNLWSKGDLLVEFTAQSMRDAPTAPPDGQPSPRRVTKTLRALASDVAKHHKTLERWRYTALTFKLDSRIMDLSFSHHTAAANSKKPLYWIQKAADEEWSKTQLLNAIKAAEHPEEAWVSKRIIGAATVQLTGDYCICFVGDDFELAWDTKKDDPLLELDGKVVEVEARIRVRRSGGNK